VDNQAAVLVTGGAGYVGSHVAKVLARAGYRVVVYDNLKRGHREAVRWGPLEEGDLADTARVREVLERHRIGAVLHFAALAYVGESMQQPELYFQNNVGGTLSLLNAMRATGVRKLVFSSTCAVYGTPKVLPIEESNPKAPESPYGESKLMVEQVLGWEGVCHGLQWVALRYFNAAGCDAEGEIGEDHSPETHLIPSLLDAALGNRPACPIFGDDYPTPDGTCIRDYVHVTDLASAHVLALRYLEAGGASTQVNLGTGDGYSVNQILTTAEAVVGRPIPIVRQPRRPGDPPRLVAAKGRAQEVLGWKLEHSSIENILATAWRWASRNK
jgi:UDP-arabinose 4-epimerase